VLLFTQRIAFGAVLAFLMISTASAQTSSVDSSDGSGSSAHVLPAERNPRYHINRDDVLSLTFPILPEFNQARVMVQPDGYLTLIGTEPVLVLGLTVPQAAEVIKTAYTKILHNPIVNIDLVDFQKPYFVVLGQVGKPGQYDLRYEMTTTQAIAVAGGFAPTAKTQVFLYHRGQGGWVEAKELKLKDILRGKSVEEDVVIRPGDMIFVPEKTITKIRKYVPYSFGVGTGLNANTPVF
jgi:polysaccharide export outer membrane protein